MAEQQHQEQQQQEQQQQEDQQQQQQEDQQQQEQQEQSQQNTDFPEFFFPFTFAIHQQSPQPSSQNANDQSEISPTIHFFVYPIPATEAGAQTPFIFFTPFFFPQESRRNVSESTMKELPIVEITQEHLDTQATCPICLETFSLSSTNKDDDNKTSDEKSTCSEPIRQMPCKHMFCESCLFQWLKQNNTCPLCRMEIESDNTSQQSDEQTSTESTAVPSQEDVTMDNASLPTSTESNSSTHTHSHHHNHHNHHSQPQPPLQQPQVSVGCDLGSVGCCDELQNNESHTTSPIITLPQCHHRFHASCLRTSLIVEGYSFESLTSQPLCFHCPTCRSPEIIQSDVLKMSSANLPSPQEQHQSSLPHLPVIIPHLPSDSDEMDLD